MDMQKYLKKKKTHTHTHSHTPAYILTSICTSTLSRCMQTYQLSCACTYVDLHTHTRDTHTFHVTIINPHTWNYTEHMHHVYTETDHTHSHSHTQTHISEIWVLWCTCLCTVCK